MEEYRAECKERRFPLIGVEPVMFLYMGAFMTTTVVEESFFIFKACTSNLGFPKEICYNLSDPVYHNYSVKVQVEVSVFHQYQNIAAFGIPIILAFFVGAWSDRVGRKIPLLLGLFGSIFYSVMIVVNALNETWRLEVVLFTATLPCALSGAQLTIFMACFAFLSDTTTQENRTIRVTLLEVVYLIPMPLGIAFGSYLFNGPLYHSYAKMFMVNAAFLACAFLYTLIVIPSTTSTLPNENGSSCSISHITETMSSLVSPREGSRRALIILCLISMVLYTIQRDEKRMMQIYSLNTFHWDVKEFSHFKIYMSSFYIVGLLIGVPLLKKVLKLRETYIIIIGAISHISARTIFILASSTTWFYVGATFSALGPGIAPVLRSITSKLVPTSERGKIFALFSVADTTAPLLSGFVFSQVYIHSVNTFPEAIFLVTIISQAIVFFIALFMNYLLSGRNISEAKEESDRESLH